MIALQFTLLPLFYCALHCSFSISRLGIVYPDHLFSSHLFLSCVIMSSVFGSKLLSVKAINQFELYLKRLRNLNAFLFIGSESIVHSIELSPTE